MKESQRFPLLLMEMDRFIQGHIAGRGLTYYERGLVKNIRLEEPWISATILTGVNHMDRFSKRTTG